MIFVQTMEHENTTILLKSGMKNTKDFISCFSLLSSFRGSSFTQRRLIMLKTTVIKFRENFVSRIEQCIDNHEVLKVEREKGKNFIIIGEGDWIAIEETLYLNQIPGLAESIRKAAGEPLSEGTPLEELDW